MNNRDPNNRRDLIEWTLGDPANYLPNRTDESDLRKWATLCGMPPVAVHAMSFVDLVNLYHAGPPLATPTDIQRATSDAVAAVMATLPAGRFPDEELVRYLARDEIAKAGAPTQRIEIVRPDAPTVVIDGPVHYRTPMVIRSAARGDAVMMVGPAGCGKTTIGEHVALALALRFYITNVINETHELTGYMDGHGNYHSTPFRQAFEHGGVWIADEIDAWDSAALLAANSALANGFINFPDQPAPTMRHPDFRMIATANTFGTGADRVYVGRNELDAASLDRFALITVDYDLDLERLFSRGQDRWLEHVWSTRKAVNEHKIRHVVSSRAITRGALALSDNESWSDVCDMYLYKGMSAKDRDKLTDDRGSFL